MEKIADGRLALLCSKRWSMVEWSDGPVGQRPPNTGRNIRAICSLLVQPVTRRRAMTANSGTFQPFADVRRNAYFEFFGC
jgi:hypothetical protein